MIETITQWLYSNYNFDKAEKHNGWTTMIGIILASVHVQLQDKWPLELASPS